MPELNRDSQDTPRDPASSRGPLEQLYVVFVLLLFTDAARVLLLNPSGVETVTFVGDPVSMPALIVAHAVVAFRAALHPRIILRLIATAPALWALTAFCAASFLWSTDPGVTFRAGVWLVSTGLFGVYLCARFTDKQILDMVAVTLALIVVSSLLFVFVWPQLGIDPSVSGHAWRGVFIQKNVLGREMALALLVFSLVAWQRPLWSPLLIALTVAAAILLVGSQSGTAIIVVGSLLLSWIVWLFLKWKRIPLAVSVSVVAVVVVVAAVVGIANWNASLRLIGRDPSLTGRTALWLAVLEKIGERPWFGYGSQAFWHGHHADYASVWRAVGWAPLHAHNGFLDLVLNAGVFALALFLAISVRAVSDAVVISRRARRSSPWHFLYLAFFLIGNITESTIIRQNSIFWVLFVAVVTQLSFARQHPERMVTA